MTVRYPPDLDVGLFFLLRQLTANGEGPGPGPAPLETQTQVASLKGATTAAQLVLETEPLTPAASGTVVLLATVSASTPSRTVPPQVSLWLDPDSATAPLEVGRIISFSEFGGGTTSLAALIDVPLGEPRPYRLQVDAPAFSVTVPGDIATDTVDAAALGMTLVAVELPNGSNSFIVPFESGTVAVGAPLVLTSPELLPGSDGTFIAFGFAFAQAASGNGQLSLFVDDAGAAGPPLVVARNITSQGNGGGATVIGGRFETDPGARHTFSLRIDAAASTLTIPGPLVGPAPELGACLFGFELPAGASSFFEGSPGGMATVGGTPLTVDADAVSRASGTFVVVGLAFMASDAEDINPQVSLVLEGGTTLLSGRNDCFTDYGGGTVTLAARIQIPAGETRTVTLRVDATDPAVPTVVPGPWIPGTVSPPVHGMVLFGWELA